MLLDFVIDNPEDGPTEESPHRTMVMAESPVQWDEGTMTIALHIRWVIPE